MINLREGWVEYFVVVFLVTGFFIAIFLRNPFFSYLTASISGFVSARVYYVKRYKEPILPFVLIIASFLLGYLFGGFWVNRLLLVLLFVFTFSGSYYLHLKKILVIFKSKDFIK